MSTKHRIARIVLSVLVGLIALTAAGCRNPFTVLELLDGPDGTPLAVEPGSGVVLANDTVALLATGGHPPYSYELVSGVGNLDGNLYTAPATPGNETVRVGDAAGNSLDVVFSVNTGELGLGISPSAQTVYTGDSVTFYGIGGTGPFTYAITDNQSGAPTMAGNVYTAGRTPGTDTVTVVDTADASSAGAVVAVQAKPLSVSPSAITVYVDQTVTFAAVGGDGPFSFDVTLNGTGAPPMSGNLYTAGPNPGTDEVTLTDGYDGRTVVATVTVVDSPVVTNVDYAVSGITSITGGVKTSTLFQADMSIANLGSADGVDDVTWTVYASADVNIGGSDFIVDSGKITNGLDADDGVAGSGTDEQAISINGRWPSVPGNYRLLVYVTAADDLTTSNNTNSSSAQTYVTEPVSVSPSSFSVYTEQQIQFSATGEGPFEWTLPVNDSGGNIDTITGLYTAGLGIGADTVQVTDTYDGSTASATVNVQPTPLPTAIDYVVDTVNVNVTGTTTGDPVDGTLDLRNQGSGDGSQTVSWTVYASLDTAVGGSDYVIDSGQTVALAASGTASINFSGTWPVVPNAYHVVAQISALDDTNTGNDVTASSGSTTITGPPPPDVDYVIASISSTNLSPNAGSAVGESFVLQNIGTDAGSSSVTWSVYLSTDDSITTTGDNKLLDTGIASALAGDNGASGGPDEAAIAIAGDWPQSPGTWYLIVSESADDETAPGDVLASAAFSVQSVTRDVDYRVSSPPPGGTGSPGIAFSEPFTVSNQGTDAGVADLTWSAYLSANSVYDAGVDTLIDSGGVSGGLASGGSSSPTIDSTWPGTTGQYYLIVRLAASDDVDPSNDVAVSGAYFVSAPGEVDYEVTQITMDYPTARAGSPIQEGFTITNTGSAPGTDPYGWNVYISADATLDGSDTRVDAQTGLLALGAGDSLMVPSVTAFWPNAAGVYYLLVEVVATDDADMTNNVSAQGPFDIQPPPDYTIGTMTIPPGDAAPGTDLSTLGVYEFTVQNIGADGASLVSWSVYASLDTGVDEKDTLLKSGVISALPASSSSGPIGIGDATWPDFGAQYYLVFVVEAADDANSQNNSVARGPKNVPESYVEGTENNDDTGPTATTLTNVSKLDAALGGDLSPNQLIRADGYGDGPGLPGTTFDTYAVTIGSGVTSISVRAVWSSGSDSIDLYVWDEFNWEGASRDIEPNREPGLYNYTVVGWSDGETAYVGVEFLGGYTGEYRLYIKGE